MSEGAISMKKAIPIIAVTWIISLLTTLALVYFAPSIFPPVSSANISNGAVVSDKIADEAVITTKLADGTVNSAKILDGSITAVDMADGAVITLKIASGAITTSKIADGAVVTSKIEDDAIVTVKLHDGSVTSAKILDGTIIASDLNDGAITEIKIADGAVSNSKLASGAIPFNSTYSDYQRSTTSTYWIDIDFLQFPLNITLARTSHLLIMFTCEAWLEATGNAILIRALVDSDQAYPRDVPGWTSLLLTTTTERSSFSYIFYKPNVSAGIHTVKIQWHVDTYLSAGRIGDRALTVIALPA